MEPGHLLHSVLTCPPSGNARHLKSRHAFVPAAQQLTSSPDNNNRSGALLGGSPMECRVAGEHYETPYFQPRHRHPPSGMAMPMPRAVWIRLNHLRTGIRCFCSWLHNGAWPLLRFVSVARRNSPLIMLSSNDQHQVIYLPVDCII